MAACVGGARWYGLGVVPIVTREPTITGSP